MNILNTVLPVFLVIALGAILRKSHFITADFVTGINKFAYRIGLPCLLFYKMSTATYDYSIAGKVFAVVLGGLIACAVIGIIIAWLFKLPSKQAGAFVQGAFRGNLAYIGLPIVLYSFSDFSQITSSETETIGVLVLSLIVPVYNISAVTTLLVSQHQMNFKSFLNVLKQIGTNPLIIACVSGIAYASIFDSLPITIGRSFNALGQVALPMALIGIGATLIEEKLYGKIKFAIIAAAIKTTIAPLSGLLTIPLLGLSDNNAKMAMIFLACPTAISSYVLADQLGSDKRTASMIVILSTLFSLISLSIVVSCY